MTAISSYSRSNIPILFGQKPFIIIIFQYQQGTDLKTDELISVDSIYCKSSYLTSNWKRDQNYPIFIKLQVHCSINGRKYGFQTGMLKSLNLPDNSQYMYFNHKINC